MLPTFYLSHTNVLFCFWFSRHSIIPHFLVASFKFILHFLLDLGKFLVITEHKLGKKIHEKKCSKMSVLITSHFGEPLVPVDPFRHSPSGHVKSNFKWIWGNGTVAGSQRQMILIPIYILLLVLSLASRALSSTPHSCTSSSSPVLLQLKCNTRPSA